MVRQPLVHQCHHFLGDGVWFKTAGFGQQPRPLFAKAASVVCVKVPLVAQRFFAVHQDAGLLAQLAVEKFQAQLFASTRMLGKVTHGAKEMRVVANLNIQGMGPCHLAQAL